MTYLTDDINACAEMVQKGDPDRFMAVMSARPEQRAPLFILYAFNLEVARAAWASQEPMVGQMRLQFWRDVVESANSDAVPRAHEVARPLTLLIREKGLDASVLDDLIAARWWDLNKDPFADEIAFHAHIAATSGGLMRLAAKSLGAPDALMQDIGVIGNSHGIVTWFQAIPELESRGRQPLHDGRLETVRDLATTALHNLNAVHFARAPWCAALRSAWQTKAVLKQIKAQPERVAQGAVGLSEFHKKRSLFFKTLVGRY
ncbi:squalene/phytoene synthase family protein [Halocynthiibacter namhaensis]|uniref:squalene/phytoene synthase family protein n=1 Tax=Halocynthiibacter namhaensis TaxID=1290553 RepID=UPI000ADF0A07|nr:squalene/phytoene synthase family protein [Halocynthiibacter namhaensis]